MPASCEHMQGILDCCEHLQLFVVVGVLGLFFVVVVLFCSIMNTYRGIFSIQNTYKGFCSTMKTDRGSRVL